MIDRQRPQRPSFVAPWVLPVAGGFFAVLVLGVVLAVWLGSRSMVVVPDVVGVSESVARVRLAQAGLVLEVGERPFDAAETGTVLDQNPAPGSELAEGDAVVLTVSAGTEEFEMPDVTGLTLRIAQAQLEDLGLTLKIERVESDAPADTVLATNPSPGATVRTSDIVRVTVATAPDANTALLPYRLDGALVVIDPAVPAAGRRDVEVEVGRRLQALLQASGARVVMTRSSIATGSIEPTASAEPTSGAAALVVIDAEETGNGGITLVTVPEPAPTAASSTALAGAVATFLGEAGVRASRETGVGYPSLTGATGASLALRLGSWSLAEDATAFADPAWADRIARAVYRGIGERLGAR